MFSNQVKDFEKLTNFNTLDEFNESFYIAMKQHRDAFSKGELIALKTLKNWGAKIVGVVYAKIGTIISELIKQKGEMCVPSRSTFERAIRKAKKLGIIKTIETKQGIKKERRRRNLRGNNVYIFELFSDSEQLTERKDEKLTERENAETPHNQAVQTPEIEGDTSLSNTSKNNLSSLRTKRDSTYVSERVLKVAKFLVDKLKPFFDDADIIEDCFYNAVNIMDSYYREGYEFANRDNFMNFASEAVNALVKAERREALKNKRICKPVGYFTNAFKQMVEVAAENERNEAEENAPIY